MDKEIIMSVENTNSETCLDNNNTVGHSSNSEKNVEISDDINHCVDLNDDDVIIIEDDGENYKTANSRKRKDEDIVEETVFNYLTGMYEKVKRSKLEEEDEVHEETETSKCEATHQNDLSESNHENPNTAQTDSSSTTTKCEGCDFEAVSKQQLKFHLFKTHLQGTYTAYFRCRICNFKTYHEKPMLIHQFDNHQMKNDNQDIINDISLNNNVEVNVVSEYCKLDTDKCEKYEMLKSIKNYHKNFYKCFDCNYIARKRESLQNHVLQHEYSDFVCDEHPSLENGCVKCVYRCCLMMLPYKVLKCFKCGFKTCKYNHYVKHNNRLVDCTNKDSAKRSQIQTNKVLKCYHCSYSANSRNLLKLHAEKHRKQEFDCDLHPHETDNECTKCLYKTILEEVAKEVVYSCQFCNFKTKEKFDFSEHQSNKGNCEKFQTVNLCSDNSDDEDL